MSKSPGATMPELLQQFNWQQTAVGAMGSWPLSLRITVSTIMAARFPMLLLWGPRFIQIYNDAFRQCLGDNGKHPAALGAGAADTWSKIWPVLEPRFKEILAGQNALFQEDALFPLTRDGEVSEVYWTFSCSAVRDENGLVQGILVVCYDSTEKIRNMAAEVRSREQQQKLLTLVDNSVDLMSILELDGTNSYINEAGRNILGIDADADVRTIPIADFHTPEQLAFVEAEIIPSVMGKGRWAGQFAVRNAKTGEIIPLFNNCHRITDTVTGQPIGIGAVMRDMRPELNARKILEEKVAERTQELQRANEELEKINKDLASFAYVSSHDLQEPLRKINTFVSRIENESIENLTGNQRDLFERIKRSAYRMHTLINDLLSFSRTSSAERIFKPVDLQEMVTELAAGLQERIPSEELVFESDMLPVINAIPYQMHQLFDNLFSNAIKFRKPGVALALRVGYRKVSGKHLITVEDNGIGFEPQYNERIFEVFQRLHGRYEYDGTGIGLAICKKILENHSGSIYAEGQKGIGAKFMITLPER